MRSGWPRRWDAVGQSLPGCCCWLPGRCRLRWVMAGLRRDGRGSRKADGSCGRCWMESGKGQVAGEAVTGWMGNRWQDGDGRHDPPYWAGRKLLMMPPFVGGRLRWGCGMFWGAAGMGARVCWCWRAGSVENVVHGYRRGHGEPCRRGYRCGHGGWCPDGRGYGWGAWSGPALRPQSSGRVGCLPRRPDRRPAVPCRLADAVGETSHWAVSMKNCSGGGETPWP